jgi:hypothetical protein
VNELVVVTVTFMFGSTAVTGSSSYSQMSQLRPPVHSQAMLIPGHPHHMMMGHSAHGMSPMSMGSAQSPNTLPSHNSLKTDMALNVLSELGKPNV